MGLSLWDARANQPEITAGPLLGDNWRQFDDQFDWVIRRLAIVCGPRAGTETEPFTIQQRLPQESHKRTPIGLTSSAQRIYCDSPLSFRCPYRCSRTFFRRVITYSGRSMTHDLITHHQITHSQSNSESCSIQRVVRFRGLFDSKRQYW